MRIADPQAVHLQWVPPSRSIVQPGSSVAASLGELVCGVLRAEAAAWPAAFGPEHLPGFHRYSDHHGVQSLLYARLKPSATWGAWPAQVRHALSRGAASAAALDILQRRETTRVVSALVRRGVGPLLMKGAALACTLYRAPQLRPRGDLDILIRQADRAAAERVLRDLGYGRVTATRGELVSYEFTMTKVDRHGVEHVIDVHWRVSNCQVFARALSFDELLAAFRPVPALGPGARAPGPVHALLLACMHRVAHVTAPYYWDGVPVYGDRLIWLYDIHLLVGRLSPEERPRFAGLAADRRLRTICLDGLRQARRCFGTELPDDVVESLSAIGPRERSAAHLRPGRLRYLVRDIWTLPDWRSRLCLAKEHLLPPADYVLHKYDVSNRLWLPALYLRRAITGLWRGLREG